MVLPRTRARPVWPLTTPSPRYRSPPAQPILAGMMTQELSLLTLTLVAFVMLTLYIMRRRVRLGRRQPKF